VLVALAGLVYLGLNVLPVVFGATNQDFDLGQAFDPALADSNS
jgi:hypothetical protein